MNAPIDNPSFAIARRLMVESQLRPQAVIDQAVLGAMDNVPRERFVPPEQAAFAYSDRAAPLGGGRFLSPPAVTGRLLSELAPVPGERALIVGSASGYSAAVLAEIGVEVTALDTMAPLAEVPGVAFVSGPMAEGWAVDAPYDLVLIDGSIGFLPEAIIEQLAPSGRLGAVLRDRGIDRLVIGQRSDRGFGLRSIADSEAPELPGFERPPVFTF